jgi:hypothetical protein
MGDLYNMLDSEDFREHLFNSKKVWDEICEMDDKRRASLRQTACEEINIDRCDFLGKPMRDFLVKQRMIAIMKGYPVPKI